MAAGKSFHRQKKTKIVSLKCCCYNVLLFHTYAAHTLLHSWGMLCQTQPGSELWAVGGWHALCQYDVFVLIS